MGRKILFVEDEAHIRLQVVHFLTVRGYDVDSVACMKDAQEKLNHPTTRYGLILSDYYFPYYHDDQPQRSGIELLTMLRNGIFPQYEEVPFVLHTSDDSPSLIARTKELGGDYCAKRFNCSYFDLFILLEQKLTHTHETTGVTQ